MKYVLIQIDPLQLADQSIDGYPVVREVGDPLTWASPDGYTYIPAPDEPTDDPGEGNRWVRNLTETEYGWIIGDALPEEVTPNEYFTGVSKFTIMKRLQYLEKWTTFKLVIDGMSEDVQDAWHLALEIKQDDPMFMENKPALCAALELTEQQVDDLLDPYSNMPEGPPPPA